MITSKYYLILVLPETPDYSQLCVLNVDYDQGETLDTWNDLCNAISNSVKTVLDPTWSMSFKFDKTSPVAMFIIGKEYSVGRSDCTS